MSNYDDSFDTLRSTKTDPTFLNALMERLEPFLNYKLVPINSRFILSASQSKKCYFVKSGSFSLYRQPNDILVELFDAPTLRGAIHHPDGSQSLYILKVIYPCEMAIIERDELFSLFTQHNLWELFARHQVAINSMVAEKMFKLMTPSVYDIIRLQLYELMNTSSCVRESITVEAYIRSKTRISRSSIMRILSDLKVEGYIDLDRGKLKSLNFLPKKFK